MKTRILVPAVLLTLSWAALGLRKAPPSARPPMVVAKEYLAAYQARDWTKLESMYTEDATWQDPTSAQIGGVSDIVKGRDEVLANLKNATAGILELEFDLPKQFHSAGLVVSIGRLKYSIPHFDPARADETLKFDIDTVIVLEVDGEHIRRHTDYADFEAWLRQYQKQS